MSRPPHTVYCVGSSTLVREVAAALPPGLRSRWMPDAAALARAIGASRPGDAVAAAMVADVAGVVVEANAAAVATLAQARAIAPAARRLAVADACDLRLVRDLLDSRAADEIVYRPLDPMTLAQAFAPPRPPTARGERLAAKTFTASPTPAAASPAAASRG